MHHKLYALEPIKVYQICIAWMRVWYGRLQEETHAKSKGFWFSCWDWRDMLSRAGSGCDVNDPDCFLAGSTAVTQTTNSHSWDYDLELDGSFRLGLGGGVATEPWCIVNISYLNNGCGVRALSGLLPDMKRRLLSG
jgi:hypothetical protein